MKERGVTLIEMLVVVTIVSLAAGLSYPSLVSGLEALRINDSAAQVANFLSGAMNRVERRQQVLELAILPAENTLRIESPEPGYVRELKITGAKIHDFAPKSTQNALETHVLYLIPGSVAPRLTIVLANKRGNLRTIRLDPATGVPVIER